MAAQPWTRMAMRTDASRDQLDEVASRETWILDEIVKADDDRPFELVWLTEDEETSVHYIEDKVLGLDLVLVRGDVSVAEVIRPHVDTVARSEVLKRGREAHGKDLVKAAYLVAASASSEFDADEFAIVERAADDDDPEVRRSAAVSMGYLQWHQCRAALDRLAGDSDAEVRRTAAIVLEGLDEVMGD